MFPSVKSLLIFSFLVLISACNSNNNGESNVKYANTVYGYAIQAPNHFEIGKHAVQGVIQGPGLYAQDGTNIDIYDPASPDAPSRCSPSLTGTSQTKQLIASAQTEWGRVDFFDQFKGGENPDADHMPLCRPTGSGVAYSLCSEKDGKTVVICISQMTDNPQLAEDIFKTFRWTKE